MAIEMSNGSCNASRNSKETCKFSRRAISNKTLPHIYRFGNAITGFVTPCITSNLHLNKTKHGISSNYIREMASDRYVPPPLASSRSSCALLFHRTFRKVVVSRSVARENKRFKVEFWHRSPPRQGEGSILDWKQAIPRNLRAISLRRFVTRYSSLFPGFFSSPIGPRV